MLRELCIFVSIGASPSLLARSVYLNGTDISSAFSQELKKVDVEIDAKGNVFIIAPHYSVHEEESFVPLSTAQPVLPKHKVPTMIHKGENQGVPTIEGGEPVKSKSPAVVSPPTQPASDQIPAESPLEKSGAEEQK
ncbi:MAG: hypothetical protein HYW48_06110 [Deltaproteobacteria bacterium]|nr:hypothetical protein [Deltaproteobacteria bacterium]